MCECLSSCACVHKFYAIMSHLSALTCNLCDYLLCMLYTTLPQVKEALEDVIIVDADTGDCTVMGRGPAVPVPNFFDDMSGGDEGGADRDSSSGGGSLGKLKAMKGLFKTSSSKPERTLYVRDGGGGSSCDQVNITLLPHASLLPAGSL